MKTLKLTVVLFFLLSSLALAGVDTSKVQIADQNGTLVSASNPLNVTASSTAGSVTPADTFTNPTNAISSFSLGGVWNGTTWDKLYGDKTNGAFVNIKNSITLTVQGGVTPADNFSNPTTAVNNFALLGAWSGTLWNRVNGSGPNIQGDSFNANVVGINVTSFPYLMNGSGLWDRQKSGINIGQALVDSSSNATNNITTNTTTSVKATGGVLNAVIINTAGTSSTVAFYNIASAGCTGTPGSGYAFTLATAALSLDSQINHTFTLGICAVTAGAGAANISVLYR